MKLYHGTSYENAIAIQESGIINGPVFMTANRNAAGDYAGDGEVLEVYVDESELMIDLDMPGAALITVDEACEYLGEESVAVNRDVSA